MRYADRHVVGGYFEIVNYQRWRNLHRNPYLDTVPRYTHEDYCNEIYNYLQMREFDRNLERFMKR
jgi:hypothetical protein